jgi:hypothetical protein
MTLFDPKCEELHGGKPACWGLTWYIESLCFYCKFVVADSLVYQNPPLRQAWEL